MIPNSSLMVRRWSLAIANRRERRSWTLERTLLAALDRWQQTNNFIEGGTVVANATRQTKALRHRGSNPQVQGARRCNDSIRRCFNDSITRPNYFPPTECRQRP